MEFQDLQRSFAAHIRHPERNPRPGGIEARRMAIYNRLFFNTVESGLAKVFPKAKDQLGENEWHALVRDFVDRHTSTTPFFRELPLEFMLFLHEEREPDSDPTWLLELCNFEWQRRELDLSEDEIPREKALDDAQSFAVGTSPTVRVLGYRWPVHKVQIGDPRLRTDPPEERTWLIAFRDRQHDIHYMQINQLTAMWLERLKSAENPHDAMAALIAPKPLRADQSQTVNDLVQDLLERNVLYVM